MEPAPRTIAEVVARIQSRGAFSLGTWDERWASALVDAWNDPDIAEWNPVPPEPGLELAQSWIRGTSAQNEASVGVDVVMVDETSENVAGEIGLQVDPSQGIAEVGFWLGEAFRGQGVGKPLLAFAQDLAAELELAGLVALVDPKNAPAIGLLESVAWPEVPTKSHRRAFIYRVP